MLPIFCNRKTKFALCFYVENELKHKNQNFSNFLQKNSKMRWSWLLTNHFPLPPSTFCTVNLCAHVKTHHLQLVHTHMNVSTVASWIQSVANHIYHISQAGIEMLASLCNLFSPHLCLLDPLIMQPCNDIVPGGQEPVSLTQIRLRLCFKTQQ